MDGLPNLTGNAKESLEKAVRILKEEGCTEVYVFGSVARGEGREESDIDLAVKGCREAGFFHVFGRLLMALDCPVDLVDLDADDPFVQHLEQQGRLRRIA